MLSLFIRECKEISKSLIYIVYLVITIACFISICSEDLNYVVKEPVNVGDAEKYYEENGNYPYGVTESKFSESKSPLAFRSLFKEYKSNKYSRYPFGFLKRKSLSSEDQREVEDILTKISNSSLVEIESILNSNDKKLQENLDNNITHNFDEFSISLEEVDKLLGGKSSYEKTKLDTFYGGGKPLTYEDDLQEYKDFLYEDGVLQAYARPFAYKMNMITSVFSVIVVVFFTLKDKRSKMNETIYCKEISSKLLLTVRYVSLIVMIMLPIFILAIYSTISLSSMANMLNPNYDYLAFIKYTVTWILPTVLFVSSVGVLITLLTNSQAAIVISVVLWFQNTNLPPDYFGLDKLILRFNYIGGKRHLLMENSRLIIANRLFYTLLAIILLVLCINIFSMKRSGRINAGFKGKKAFSNMFNKSKDIVDI